MFKRVCLQCKIKRQAKDQIIKVESQNFPPPVVTYCIPMTHEKAIEILAAMRDRTLVYDEQDIKAALTMAMAGLIADKLNFERL